MLSPGAGKIIGNVNWASYAVNFAQAHFRNLQSLYNSFPKDDLDLIVSLTQEAWPLVVVNGS